jgi:RHS repeat-associated protein
MGGWVGAVARRFASLLLVVSVLVSVVVAAAPTPTSADELLDETLTVPMNSSVGVLSSSLDPTVSYRFEVSGTYSYDASGNAADAECAVVAPSPVWQPNLYAALDPTGDLLDLYVNQQNVVWQPTTPDVVGCNATDHRYSLVFRPTEVGSVRFSVHDRTSAELDNVGALSVHITEVPPPPGTVDTTIETLSVPSTSAGGAATTTLLQAGRSYDFDVTGTFTFSSQTPGDADAKCAGEPPLPMVENPFGVVFSPTDPSDHPLGLLVEGHEQPWQAATPLPTGCDPDHHYALRFTPSSTGSVTFAINDSNYADNVGALTVRVRYATDEPIGGASTLPPLPTATGGSAPDPVTVSNDFVDPPPYDLSKLTATLGAFDPSVAEVVDTLENGLVYRSPDGSRTTRLHLHPVNWKDGAGAWHAIDTHLVAGTTPLTYKNASGPFTATFPQASTALNVMKMTAGSWSYAEKLEGMAIGSVGTVSGSSITYPNLLSGIDVRYRVDPDRVKQQIVLHSAPVTPLTLRFPLTLTGLTPSTATDGTIVFKDTAGQTQLVVPPDAAFDAAATPAQSSVSVAVSGVAGAYVLEVTPNAAWLANPARVFPVTIDPTTIFGGRTSTGSDAFASSTQPTQNFNNGYQTSDGSHYLDKVGFPDGTSSEFYSYLRYDLSSLTGKAIGNATWRAHVSSSRQLPDAMTVWRVTGQDPCSSPAQPWTEWSIKWNCRPNHSSVDITYADVSAVGQWASADITPWVVDWTKATGSTPNYGISLDTEGDSSSGFTIGAAEMGFVNPPDDPILDVTWSTPPTSATLSDPADTAVLNTRTPKLKINAGSDPEGPVDYWYRVMSGPDGQTGAVVDSGWTTATEWPVPAGSLEDNGRYTWVVITRDSDKVQVASSVRSFRVNLRLGDDPASPTDTLGPATVNLATGNLVVHSATPTVQTVGGPLGVTFTYNSLQPANGLRGSYFTGCTGESPTIPATAAITRRDLAVAFNWADGSPAPSIGADEFCARWTGTIRFPNTGSYKIGAYHDDGVRIFLNNETSAALDVWRDGSISRTPEFTGARSFSGGTYVPIKIEFYEHLGNASISLMHQDSAGNVGAVPAAWLFSDVAALPPGWTLGTTASATVPFTSAVVTADTFRVSDPDGVSHEFRRSDTSGQASAWTPEPGDTSILTRDASTGDFTLHGSDDLTYTFNANGQLKKAISGVDDVKPAAPVYSYGTDGKLAAIQDPVSGRSLSLKYGDGATTAGCPAATGFDTAPSGLLCQITQLDGTITNLFYLTGRLARIERPGSDVTNFGYDTYGRLATIRDPLTNDGIAAQKVTGDDTANTAITYQSDGRVQDVTLPAAAASVARQKHTYTYDQTAPSATSTWVTSATFNAGDPIRKAGFDRAGRLIDDVDAAGHHTTTSWDVATDLVLSKTDPAGRVSTNVYDKRRRLTHSYGPAPAACINSSTRAPQSCTISGYPDFAVSDSETRYDENIAGLAATYWDNATLASSPRLHQTGVGTTSGTLDRTWTASEVPTAGAGFTAANWSARYTGRIVIPTVDTNYQFALSVRGGARLYLDDKLLIDAWTIQDTTTALATFANPACPSGVELPLDPCGTDAAHRVRVDFRPYVTGGAQDTSRLQLLWRTPGTSTNVVVPGDKLTADYNLVTTTISTDGSSGSSTKTVATNYARPETGLATSTVEDPTGLALTTSVDYGTATDGGYNRRKSRTLPAGNRTDDAYYGDSETIVNPCTSLSTNQAGLLHTRTAPDPDGAGPLVARVQEYVYDPAGRLSGTRVGTDSWSCIRYDSRGRVIQQTVPSRNNEASRTISFLWAVKESAADTYPSPYITSVDDAAGYVVTFTDRLGRTIKTRDVYNSEITTAYDVEGRVTDRNGPNAATIHNTYDADGRLLTESVDGTVRADASSGGYNSAGELVSVSYGNGTAGSFGRDPAGRTGSITWTKNTTTLGSDQVTYSRAGRIVDETIDGTDPYTSGRNFAYDTIGRLTTARVPGHTLTYDFASTNSCGASAAGKNTNRTAASDNGGAATSYCYDNADRLTSTSDSRFTGIGYDDHGNTTTIGGQYLAFDGSDRHTNTITGTKKVRYTRDALNRIVGREVSTPATITLRATATNTTGGASSLTISKPAGTTMDDVQLAEISVGGGGDTSITPPNGWTKVKEQALNKDVRTAVYSHKTVATGEPASYTWTFANQNAPSQPAAGGIAAYQNVDTAMPINDARIVTNTGSSGSGSGSGGSGSGSGSGGGGTAGTTTHTISAITALDPQTMLLAFYGLKDRVNVTNPTGMTERWDLNGSNGITVEMADETRTSIGGTGDRTGTSNNATVSVDALIALTPAQIIESAERYGFAGSDDNPETLSDNMGALKQRFIPLLGGVNLTIGLTSADDVWSYPNIHGDTALTARSDGTKIANHTYDPYGQTLGALPDNANDDYDYGWLGRHQRGTEHETGNPAVEMGARIYTPGLGRFLETDPIEGGSANDYDYVSGDPIAQFDLDGSRCFTGKNKNGSCRSLSRGSGRAARHVYRHGNVSVGGCFYICGNVTLAHGHLYGTGGGVGMGLRGLGVGWTSATPEEQRRWGIQSCAALGIGGCVGMGETTETKRLWNGSDWESYHPSFFGFNVQIGAGVSSGPTYTRRLF